MKLFKLKWYSETYNIIKEAIITKEDVALENYEDLKNCLSKGSWISLKELIENENSLLVEGETIRYNDI